MKESDLEKMNALIHDDLVFNISSGQIITRYATTSQNESQRRYKNNSACLGLPAMTPQAQTKNNRPTKIKVLV